MCVPKERILFWQDNNKKHITINCWKSFTFEIFGYEEQAPAVEGIARSKQIKTKKQNLQLRRTKSQVVQALAA